MEKKIRREAVRQAISSAFFDWTSATTIALTLLLFASNLHPFSWWQSWFWVAGGIVAELALIGASLTDPKHWQKSAHEQLTQEYNPEHIRNRRSRERLERGLEYRVKMEELIHEQSGAMRVHLQNAAEEMEKGISVIYTLGRQLDALMENDLIKRDIQMVPQAIKQTEKRLAAERDPVIRAELERALRTKQAQHENLRQLESNMKRADIQIDNMLAAMGTAYTQMQLIDSKDMDSSRARHLREDVAEQVVKTQDIIYAMDEVQQYSAK